MSYAAWSSGAKHSPWRWSRDAVSAALAAECIVGADVAIETTGRPMISTPILGLGFLVGMQHALEADHIAAVSSIAARETSSGGHR